MKNTNTPLTDALDWTSALRDSAKSLSKIFESHVQLEEEAQELRAELVIAKKELVELQKRMLTVMESPKGQNFTASQQCETANRLCDELEKTVDSLSAENSILRKQHEEDLKIICATQLGRTQWNAKEIWKKNETLLTENEALKKVMDAAKIALEAGQYVVQLLEANVKAGNSPNPCEKADWIGSCAHVYAAMAFVNPLNSAINAFNKERK